MNVFLYIYYSSAFRRAAAAVALTESDDFLRSTSLPPNAPSGPRVRVIISIARRLAQMYESKNVAHIHYQNSCTLIPQVLEVYIHFRPHHHHHLPL